MVAKAIVALMVVAALGLAACGEDDDDEETAATTETTEETTTEAAGGGQAAGGYQVAGGGQAAGGGKAAGGGETVKVSETDFAIDPANPTVEAGTVTFDVSNDGQTVHNLEVEGQGVEAEIEGDLQPGDSGKLTVDLKPGTYEYYCPVGNHAELGMEGELTVE